ERARVNHASRGRDGVAARGARAAAADAGGWGALRRVGGGMDATNGRVPPGPERNGFRRGSQLRDRISLGRGSIRSDAGHGGRPYQPQVAVILVGGYLPGVRAVIAATQTIPIVFTTQTDPVAAGVVPSLNRPGGNVTGVTGLGGELGSKRLELLHEAIPKATKFAALVNPANPVTTQEAVQSAQMA